MKRTLREHAQHVAARERELNELRLEVAGRQGRRRAPAPTPAPAGPDRSDELAKKIAEAEKREQEAVQELALAKAERERLDEREQAIRRVERELAGLRVKLEQERARLAGGGTTDPAPSPKPEGEPPAPTPLPQPPAEPDLEPAADATPRRRSSSTKAS
jgi:hypothetical protein